MSFPVLQSVLSAEKLFPSISKEFAHLGKLENCQFFYHGLNDIYRAQAGPAKYMLRVYRAGWRTNAEVLFEVEMLNHAKAKGVGVAAPVPRSNGEYFLELDAPEGPRQAVLFSFAPGGEMRYNEEQARLFGGVVAELHNALDDFKSSQARLKLDLDHLLHEPLRLMEPLYRERPAQDWQYITNFARQLEANLLDLDARGLERGVCHGDLHMGNVHYEPGSGQLTLLDFDCAGIDGWRAYELAVFRWASRARLDKPKARVAWEAYLDGYTRKRTLAPLDLEAVPLFIPLRQIWIMGLYARLGANFHYETLPDHYLSGMVNYLKEYEAGYFDY